MKVKDALDQLKTMDPEAELVGFSPLEFGYNPVSSFKACRLVYHKYDKAGRLFEKGEDGTPAVAIFVGEK